MVNWLHVSSGLSDQEVRGSIAGLAAIISNIGYLLLSSCDMAEISLKRRKSSKQPTNLNIPINNSFIFSARYYYTCTCFKAGLDYIQLNNFEIISR